METWPLATAPTFCSAVDDPAQFISRNRGA